MAFPILKIDRVVSRGSNNLRCALSSKENQSFGILLSIFVLSRLSPNSERKEWGNKEKELLNEINCSCKFMMSKGRVLA